MGRRKTILWLIGIVVFIGGGAFVYYTVGSQYVYIDQAVIEAPVISLSPSSSGILQQVFVKAGDPVTTNEPVARVGDEIVKAQVSGTIVTVNQNIGQFENAAAGQAVVATMIDPTQLRVVGHIDEDKGLSSIAVGKVVKFTVDTFGSKQYVGVVDEVSQVSSTTVTNNIFNQRPTDRFDVYVRFNPMRYPELKSGMSARLWVYK